MRILSWLLGKNKPGTSAAGERTRPGTPAGKESRPSAPPAPEVKPPALPGKESVDRSAENLRRWRESGQAKAWVAAHRGQWNHDDWLALLEELKRSSFWPMPTDAVGLTLEETRREWQPESSTTGEGRGSTT